MAHLKGARSPLQRYGDGWSGLLLLLLCTTSAATTTTTTTTIYHLLFPGISLYHACGVVGNKDGHDTGDHSCLILIDDYLPKLPSAMLSNSPPAPWPTATTTRLGLPLCFRAPRDPVDTGLEHDYSLGCPLEGFYADERSYLTSYTPSGYMPWHLGLLLHKTHRQ
jgi:hypothetical protein